MKYHKKISKILFGMLSFVFVFFIFFTFVSANFSYQPLSPLPGTTNLVEGVAKVTNLGTYITGLYKIVIGISIVLAVVLFMVAGLEWMTAEAVGKKEDAIKRINAVLFGLLLTIGSWLFLNTINPNILSVDLKIDDITIDDSDLILYGGWFCQLETNGPYYGPYVTENLCISKTGCVSTTATGSNNHYCLQSGPGTGITPGAGINDTIAIKSFFDTGTTINGSFVKFPGPGLYFNGEVYLTINHTSPEYVKKEGPYKTAKECADARKSFVGNDPLKRTDACYLVPWGNSDYVLNKMLIDEVSGEKIIRDALTVGGITINNTQCEQVGQTGCTNVGGLYVSTVVSLTTLKENCDDWLGKQGLSGKCNIKLTGGTEWWPHGGGEKYVDKNPTYHRPTFFKEETLGRDVDLSSTDLSGADVKTNFNYFILKHTDKYWKHKADGGYEQGTAAELDQFVSKIGIGGPFKPGNFDKFCTKNPDAMFRYEWNNSPHWHVRFGACN